MLSVQGLSINRTISAEQRIQKCVVDIVGHDKYFALAGLLMIGDR